MTQNQKHRASNGADSKHNVFGVVIRSGTDPSIWEWFLMVQYLREIVADNYG